MALCSGITVLPNIMQPAIIYPSGAGWSVSLSKGTVLMALLTKGRLRLWQRRLLMVLQHLRQNKGNDHYVRHSEKRPPKKAKIRCAFLAKSLFWGSWALAPKRYA